MLRLSLDSLEVLDAIERKGSFAAAAEELHRVPSTVTYTIRKLEEDLDVLLFDRNGHRAKLTPAGEELLREGRHLLRAAGGLECRVKRTATGWEAELHIVMDALFATAPLHGLVERFYQSAPMTRLRFSNEVLGGSWDALISSRADLLIGAAGDSPAGGGYSMRPIGSIDYVFAVAPGHPLAKAEEPLARAVIQQHRAVVVGDTSRRTPPRSIGILFGQDTLTVPTMRGKLEAQEAALGVGFLPEFLVRSQVRAGRLVVKAVQEPRLSERYCIAWRSGEKGKALSWWLKHLDSIDLLAHLIEGSYRETMQQPSGAKIKGRRIS